MKNKLHGRVGMSRGLNGGGSGKKGGIREKKAVSSISDGTQHEEWL